MTSTILCHQALGFVQPGRGDSRAAAEGLELGVNNLSIVVNLKKVTRVSTQKQKIQTSICSFMTSPQAGAPTRPVPTLLDLGSILPTFLKGFDVTRCTFGHVCS